MNVQCRREGLCLIVSITGELDHHTCESARHIIDDEYNQQGALHIIFDFHKIDFMDSSGIGLIMGRYKKASLRQASNLDTYLSATGPDLFPVRLV
ncbi:MAG: anti-sigma factor antagonist [Clostridia bacterium]